MLILFDIDRKLNSKAKTATVSSQTETLLSKSLPKATSGRRDRSCHAVAKRKLPKKVPSAQTITCSRKFVRNDAAHYFIQTWASTLTAWVSLVQATTLPTHVPITDLNMETAAKALNIVITGKDEALLPRFGCVQLVRLFDVLQRQIRQARQNGSIVARQGRSDKTQAIDIYIKFLDMAGKLKTPRSRIWKLQQFGQRWSELSGPSTLLLSIFTRTAENFV
jgi:hypothetical protein